MEYLYDYQTGECLGGATLAQCEWAKKWGEPDTGAFIIDSHDGSPAHVDYITNGPPRTVYIEEE